MDASDVRNFFESAVGEVATQTVRDFKNGHCADEDVEEKLKLAIAGGVRDLAGWYADELHSDPDCMKDLLGDHVYGHEDEQIIVEELAQDPHYKEWAEDFLARHHDRFYPDMSGEGVDRASLSRS